MRRSKKAREDPYEGALAMLARRPYSVAELRRALERKFPASNPALRDETVARLRAQGYLDDRKFAEQVASSLARNRRFGRHRIRRELKAKLVDYRFIDPALDRAFQETDEARMLEQALNRKIRSLRLPLTVSKLHSLCRSLLRQGFAAGDIMKAVRARPQLRPVSQGIQLEALDVEEAGSGSGE